MHSELQNGKPQLNTAITHQSLAVVAVLILVPIFEGGFDHQIVYGAVFLLAASLFYENYRKSKATILTWKVPEFWLLWLIVWSAVSIFWSISYMRSMIELLQMLCYALVFLTVSRLDETQRMKTARLVLIGGAGISLLAVAEYIFLFSSRISGTFTNPNPFGIFLVMLFLAAWGSFLRNANRWIAAASVIFLIALFLSGSRGSMIAMLMAMPVLIIKMNGRLILKSVAKTVGVLVLALALTQGIMILAPMVQDTLGISRTLLSSMVRAHSFIPSSLAGRVEFWNVSTRLIAQRPLQGFGLGSYFAAYYLEYGGNHWYSRFAHNHYLQTAVETGLPGLIFLAGFLLSIFRRVFNSIKMDQMRQYHPGVWAAAVAFIIHMGVDFSWNHPGAAVVFFALLGAVIQGSEDNHPFQNHKGIRISPKMKTTGLALVLLLTVWQFSAETLYMRGYNQAAQGNLEASNRTYEITNTIYPINSVGYSLKSDNYKQMYEINQEPVYLIQAIEAMEQAVAMEPYDGTFHNQLGNLYLETTQPELAEKHLKLGVEYGAYALSRYIDLGAFYMRQHRDDEAMNVLQDGLVLSEHALRRAPLEDKERVIDQIAIANLMLANIYRQNNQEDLRQEHLQKVYDLMLDYPFLEKYFN